MVKFVSRAEWGAKPWRPARAMHRVPMSARTETLIHYHGGPPKHSRGVAVPREVEAIHLANGWAGTGYNWIIDQEGVIYEGRGWHLVGAHCPGHNRTGIGIYLAVGGDQQATPAALAAARTVYDLACRRAGRSLRMSWHGQDYPTACPGPRLTTWVRAGMPKPTSPRPTTPRPTTTEEDTDVTNDDIEAIARRVAEITMSTGARFPVVVDDGTGAAKLADGRDIDSVPTVIGEIQREHREHAKAVEAALQRIEAALGGAAPQ